jgi:hypothetical protein
MNKVVDLQAFTFFTESARKVEIKLFEQSLPSTSFWCSLLGKLSVPFVEHCSILLNFLELTCGLKTKACVFDCNTQIHLILMFEGNKSGNIFTALHFLRNL